jgi:hypothetical protein
MQTRFWCIDAGRGFSINHLSTELTGKFGREASSLSARAFWEDWFGSCKIAKGD